MKLADKLTGPFMLSTSGGIFIVIAGIERSARYIGWGTWTYGDVSGAFVLETSGVIVLLCGIMMFARPEMHQVLGALTVIAASFSLFSSSGFSTPTFSTGVLLSLVGGVLGIVLKPEVKSKEILPALVGPAEN